MENASKALIIAGAILLAILIIGLGMLIYDQARDTIISANFDQSKVKAANASFEDYLGENIKGSRVKDLCRDVRNRNLSANDDDIFEISLTYNSKTVTEATEINELATKIGNGKYYKVTCTYDKKKGGLIDTITIEDAGSKGGTTGGTVTE